MLPSLSFSHLKIRKYRADYNNNPPNTVSFMTGIVSTSGRLHSEFVRLLFLQDHRETDRFFCSFRSSAGATWSWPVPLPPRRVLWYWWGTYHFKNTYSPITLANISSINLVSIFKCSSSLINPVYVRRVDSSASVFSLSSHRLSYKGLVFNSRFIDS